MGIYKSKKGIEAILALYDEQLSNIFCGNHIMI